MKLQLTQRGTTVTIEDDHEMRTCHEMAQLFRDLLLAHEYHHKSVEEALPTEDAIDDFIAEALDREMPFVDNIY